MNPAKMVANRMSVIAGAAVAALLVGCVYSDGSGYGGVYGGGYVASSGGAGYFEVSSDNDFYEPLSPYGRWEVVGAYGRCWVPGGVGSDWEPYCNGEWVSTDDGWYFESDEPWGWATYHYGRWEDDPSIGWCWIPGTEWAPAWVSWWDSGDYIGWAPLGPGDRFEHGRFEGRRPRDRDWVFVEQRRFTDRIRPTTVVRNNTTLISRTTNITNVRVVNNVTVNAGPRREMIERASGRTVRTVPATEVRRQREAPIVQRRQQLRSSGGENVAPGRRPPATERRVTPPVSQPVTPTATQPHPGTQRPTTREYEQPRTVAPPPEGNSRVNHTRPAEIEQPRTVAPRTEGNERVNHARPVETEQHRTVAPPREVTPPPARVTPTRPAEERAAPTHISRPEKPVAAPKAQPAPKGQGTEHKGEKEEKPRRDQTN